MGKFGGFPGGMGNMQSLMKQAQKMQQDMEEKKKYVTSQEFEVSAGGGTVTVKATGAKEIKEIKIKKEIVDPEDVEMLEDIILTAVNEAIKKADDLMSETMGQYNIPGLM